MKEAVFSEILMAVGLLWKTRYQIQNVDEAVDRVTISLEKVLGKAACPYSHYVGHILSFLLGVLEIQSWFILSSSLVHHLIVSSSYRSNQPAIAS